MHHLQCEGLVRLAIIIIIIIKIIVTIWRGRRDMHSSIVHNIYIIIYVFGKPVASGRTRYYPTARGVGVGVVQASALFGTGDPLVTASRTHPVSPAVCVYARNGLVRGYTTPHNRRNAFK